MSVISEARSRLIGASAVTALIGERVYPNRVPKSVTPAPTEYVILQKIANLPDNHLEGWSGLDAVLLQVACIAASFDRADALRSAVRAAITGSDDNDFRCRAQDERDLYVPDIERHELQLDVSIWFRDA